MTDFNQGTGLVDSVRVKSCPFRTVYPPQSRPIWMANLLRKEKVEILR